MILVTGHLGFVGTHLGYQLGERIDWRGLDIKEDKDIRVCRLPDPRGVAQVFHLAAETDAQCMDVERIQSYNVTATRRLAKMYGEKLVFASSSMAAYPKSSPYAESKRAGEEVVLDFGGSVVRFCNLFGPGGHSVVDKFAEAPTLQIRGDGKQTRSYAHVDSAISLMLLATPGHKHILRGFTATVNQIADGYPTKPRVYVPASPLDIQYAPQD